MAIVAIIEYRKKSPRHAERAALLSHHTLTKQSSGAIAPAIVRMRHVLANKRAGSSLPANFYLIDLRWNYRAISAHLGISKFVYHRVRRAVSENRKASVQVFGLPIKDEKLHPIRIRTSIGHAH